MKTLDAVAAIGFIAALVALPVLLVIQLRHPERGVPVRGVVVFGALIGICLCTASTSQSWGQVRVLDALDLCSPANCSVQVNGREVSNPVEVLSTLKELRDFPAHHSSPNKSFSIDILGPSQVSLVLARDSSDPQEYWVFYPKYWITRHNPIGRLKTSIFGAY